MLRKSPCISARIVGPTSVRITVTLEMTALSDVRAVIFGMNALKLDRPLLLLPGEVVGKADHLVKVGAEVVVMDMLHFHRQVLDILAEAKVPLDLLEGRVEGLLLGDTQVLMELGTISVVPVSMVLPTEVALVTKGLALALVSLTMLQVTPQILRAVVTLGRALASAIV